MLDMTDLQTNLEYRALNAFSRACLYDRMERYYKRVRRPEYAADMRRRRERTMGYIYGLEKLMEWEG